MTIGELKAYVTKKVAEFEVISLAHRFGDAEMANISVIVFKKYLSALTASNPTR